MTTDNYEKIHLTVEREEGTKVSDNKVTGDGWFDKCKEVFHFKVKPTRVKSNTKNPIEYAGDIMTMRRQKSGAHRVTFMLVPDVKVDELEDKMVKELIQLLNSLR